jgi:hypothetical protein
MKTIYKYPIRITDNQEIQMPINAKAIHAGLDPLGTPCVWATVRADNKMDTVTVYVVGTGNPIPFMARRHVGSFNQGPFVWHVFIG